MAISLRETCLEYFDRRLSEGWKCVSRDGPLVVLLSPDGIRKEMDLRNDVLTLRPNAAGDASSDIGLTSQYPVTGDYYDKVDEVIADGDSTYLYGGSLVYSTKLFNLPASSGSGTINSVKVYCVFKKNDVAESGVAATVLKSDSTETFGTTLNPTTSWVLYSQQWNINPADSADWEWSDIDALQIGCRTHSGKAGYAAKTYCTQVYVEVDYTALSTNIKTIMGVPIADIKTINGVAIADVKSWLGISNVD